MKSSSESRAAEISDLDFPDWNGMVDSGVNISTKAAFEACEEYLRLFPKAVQNRKQKRSVNPVAEFKL